jgi:hypothetical protein
MRGKLQVPTEVVRRPTLGLQHAASQPLSWTWYNSSKNRPANPRLQRTPEAF